MTHLLQTSPRVRVEQEPSDAHVLLAIVDEPCAQQAARLQADGATIAEVVARLFSSERTVKYALHQLPERFGLRNRVHAVAWAIRSNLL